jgi:hypothetical protein
MKKIILLSLSAMALVSCTADYECNCTITQTNSGGTTVSTDKSTLIGVTKAQAESAYDCASYDQTSSSDGSTSTYSQQCTITKK